MSENTPNTLRETGAHFHSTRWSLVVAAGTDDTPHAQAALEDLCRDYWPPLYAEIRRRGHVPADAEDLTQGFFAQLLRPQAFTVAVHRLRKRFRAHVRTEVEMTVADTADVDGERQHLFGSNGAA